MKYLKEHHSNLLLPKLGSLLQLMAEIWELFSSNFFHPDLSTFSLHWFILPTIAAVYLVGEMEVATKTGCSHRLGLLQFRTDAKLK